MVNAPYNVRDGDLIAVVNSDADPEGKVVNVYVAQCLPVLPMAGGRVGRVGKVGGSGDRVKGWMSVACTNVVFCLMQPVAQHCSHMGCSVGLPCVRDCVLFVILASVLLPFAEPWGRVKRG